MRTCFRSWVRGALLLALVLVALSAGGTTPAATTELNAESGGGWHVQLVPAPQTGVIIICDEDDCSLA